MLPLLPQIMCSAAETLLTRLIAMDPEARNRLARLQGKQLSFTLREMPLTIVLTATAETILFNQHNEPVDCAISTDLASLRLLRDPSQLTRLIKADVLQIEGDIQVAQQFSYFIQQLDPDWQQALSRYTGDALAHKISYLLHSLHSYLLLKQQQLEQLTTELVQDELQLSPTPTELQLFSEQVSQLHSSVELISQKIKQIQG
ncbi:SCP2 sterol-binding domain-containing protein [Chromatiaceae bacterium AAb-1]|nr:SCP2 sterol-binding domain-containing protein [Chromatiaceae bacterium AAb-1]